jgi:hypothetical protein
MVAVPLLVGTGVVGRRAVLCGDAEDGVVL